MLSRKEEEKEDDDETVVLVMRLLLREGTCQAILWKFSSLMKTGNGIRDVMENFLEGKIFRP